MDECTTQRLKDMRLACQVMSVELHSTDRFITECIRWLGARSPQVVLERLDKSDSWSVRCLNSGSVGETLSEALAGAVFCQESKNITPSNDKLIEATQRYRPPASFFDCDEHAIES